MILFGRSEFSHLVTSISVSRAEKRTNNTGGGGGGGGGDSHLSATPTQGSATLNRMSSASSRNVNTRELKRGGQVAGMKYCMLYCCRRG